MFMKIFQTSSFDVVKDCQTMFNFRRVSELVLDRKRKFFQKYVCATILYVKLLHLWRRMSCQAYVQLVKLVIGAITRFLSFFLSVVVVAVFLISATMYIGE